MGFSPVWSRKRIILSGETDEEKWFEMEHFSMYQPNPSKYICFM
jgi:hypothetical protein